MICPQDIEKYRPHDEDNVIYDEGIVGSDDLSSRLDEFINAVRVDDEEDNKLTGKSTEKSAPSKLFCSLL